MRSLNTKIKADFVRKETSIIGPVSGADCFAQQFSGTDAYKRPKSWYKSGMTNGSEPMGSDANQTSIDVETPKKSRPRSLTFTRSKGDSNPKKERPMSHSRTKSSDSTSVNSFTSSTTAQGLPFLNRTPKVASPEDCISYLKKVRQPQLVEVGRIQKLRQLLRNETVSWVDAFVDKGGMTEVVGLLYRIIEIEWRYVHFLDRCMLKALTNDQGRARGHSSPRDVTLLESLVHHDLSSSTAGGNPVCPLPYPAGYAIRQRKERTKRVHHAWDHHQLTIYLPIHRTSRPQGLPGADTTMLFARSIQA